MGIPLILIFVIGTSCLLKETSGQNYFQQFLGFSPLQEGASYFQSYFGQPTTAHRVPRQSTVNSKFEGGGGGGGGQRPTSSNNSDDYEDDDSSGEEYSDENNNSNSGYHDDSSSSNESNGRLLSASAFNKISETLGALNTVGHFIVDMTRGQDGPSSDESSSSYQNNPNKVPDAILTLSTNVLGQNITNTIEPLIKRVGQNEELNKLGLFDGKKKKKKNQKNRKDTVNQSVLRPVSDIGYYTSTRSPIPGAGSVTSTNDSGDKDSDNRCQTPDGRPGRCEDLSSCPALLLDLGGLRDSLCFKSLFVPGVCCPVAPGSTILTTQRPLILTTRPNRLPVRQPPQRPPASHTNLVLVPQISPPSSTERPGGFGAATGTFNNIIDPDDCGQQEYSSGRIVGGIESPNGQWPWMAAIFLHGPKRTEFWCGGSLVGTKYVLTAAHCTRDSRQKPFAARQFTVRLGDIDLSLDSEPSAPVTFTVREVRAHEKFSRVGFYNDIAILVLDRPVRKSKYVIPLCLPQPGFIAHRERLPGRRATVVGWGTTYYGGKESTVQRQADLPIWRNEDCDRAYFQPINENFLCSGYSEGGVDACQGDSGGPLMMRVDSKWTQLGIVSFGNKCGEPGYPGVYTRVSQYLDWIKDHTRD